jgi:hypothetical protein
VPIVVLTRGIFNPLPHPQPPLIDVLATAEQASVLLRPNAGNAAGAGAAHAATITTSNRDGLVLGVDKPTSSNTGALQPASELIDVTSTTTYSSNNQTITGRNFLARVIVTGNNVRFENCIFRGSVAAPSGDQSLVDCTSQNMTGAYFQDCEFYPQAPHWNWDQAIAGHDYTLDRCWVHHCTDGVAVHNDARWDATGTVYNTNVIIKQSLIEDLGYWTASSGGVVHPSDNATHNDAIQLHGGLGTQILGNTIRGVYARQYGHWVETSVSTAIEDIAEPFTGVARFSLPAGAPWYAGPFQPSSGNTIPDNGSGTEATGRYNIGEPGSLACILIDNASGPTYNLVVEDNWIEGGDFAVNGGGNPNPGGGVSLGAFRRNKFDYTQSSPPRSSQSTTTQTLNFQGGGWAGFVTAPTTGADANEYYNGEAITVRT